MVTQPFVNKQFGYHNAEGDQAYDYGNKATTSLYAIEKPREASFGRPSSNPLSQTCIGNYSFIDIMNNERAKLLPSLQRNLLLTQIENRDHKVIVIARIDLG